MIRTFLHSKHKQKKAIKYYFLSIGPLIFYGIYKNSILIYQKGLINLWELFIPLLYLLIPFAIKVVYDYVKVKKLDINFDTFFWTCLGLFIPSKTNILIYLIIVTIGIILDCYLKKKFNMAVLSKLCIVLTLFFIGKYSYMNLLEQNQNYAFNFLDIFFGRAVGGVFSTSIIYAIVNLIILSASGIYKKRIPMWSILTYIVLSLIRLLFIFDLELVFSNIAGIILSISIYGAQLTYTPYTNKAMILYSILLGIFSFIFCIFLPYEGSFIAIFLLSFFYKYFDKLIIGINSTKR